MTIHKHGRSIDGSVKAPGGDLLLLPEVDDLDPSSTGDAYLEEVRRRNNALRGVPANYRFGLLPVPLVDESVEETGRIYEQLGFDGVCILPPTGEKNLDHPDFGPLLAELDRRKATILIHPADTSGEPLSNPHYLDSVLTLARLLYCGRIKMLADTKIILAHSGGIEAFLAENIGLLYYLQATGIKMGSFLFDYAIRKKLRGVELVRSIESCA